MKQIEMHIINEYVNNNITSFHTARLRILSELKLSKLIRKNPYLFRAKNLLTASDLVSGLMEAFLSSSEEKLFGDFLEGLAIFIAENTVSGRKSASPGIDLEFMKDDILFLISIKSGPNWGNSSQYSALERNFANAVRRIKQAQTKINVQPVLGICYGKSKTTYNNSYMKIMGQNFWYMISGVPDFYIDIIEPIGYNARLHNDDFIREKSAILNLLTVEFAKNFCDVNGNINWDGIVEYNSKNGVDI